MTDHVEPCGCEYRPVDVPDDVAIGQGWRRVRACAAHDRPACPDGGTCHHECGPRACYRVRYCGPLTVARFPGNRWPK